MIVPGAIQREQQKKIDPQSEHVGTTWFWTEILGTQYVCVKDW